MTGELEETNMRTVKKKKAYYKDRGVALIIAVVIMAVLIVFTFSLSLIAYSMYASQNNSIASRRCAEAANSLCDAIIDELTYTDPDNNRYPEYESYLYKYLRYNICQEATWPFYDEGKEKHTREYACRYFDLKYNTDKAVYDANGSEVAEPTQGVDDQTGGSTPQEKVSNIVGMPGKTYVCIYWKLPEEYGNNTVLPGYDDTALKSGIRLYIEVTAESGNQTYTVTRELVLTAVKYNQADHYELSRMNYLGNAANDEMINPLNLSITEDVNTAEMWVWRLPTNE